MFTGLAAVEPFSFTFNNGVVMGPNYSFDLRAPIAVLTAPEKDFYRASPQMLIHFVFEDWNKKFNPSCIKAGGNLFLGVTWDTACLTAAGTSNYLNAAGQAILSQVAAWGAAYLGQSSTGGGTTGGSTGGSAGGSTGGGTSTGTESNPFDWLSENKNMLMWVGGGLLVLMMLRR